MCLLLVQLALQARTSASCSTNSQCHSGCLCSNVHLQAYNDLQVRQLTRLIEITCTELSKADRQKVSLQLTHFVCTPLTALALPLSAAVGWAAQYQSSSYPFLLPLTCTLPLALLH